MNRRSIDRDLVNFDIDRKLTVTEPRVDRLCGDTCPDVCPQSGLN